MSDNSAPDYNPNNIHAVLSEIKTTLSGIKESVEQIDAKLDKHDTRISTLENFRYLLLGAVTVISACSSYIISKLKGEV
jgi:hypothetical protein